MLRATSAACQPGPIPTPPTTRLNSQDWCTYLRTLWSTHRSTPTLAVRQGANVRFTKTSRVLAELAGGHAERTWDKRIRELIRPDVLILDDFAMRQLSAAQADDLYELVSERQGRSLIITSNRAPSDWYPLFPNPVVAESLLDRLINTSHQVIMNGPSYRPNKRPKGSATKDENVLTK